MVDVSCPPEYKGARSLSSIIPTRIIALWSYYIYDTDFFGHPKSSLDIPLSPLNSCSSSLLIQMNDTVLVDSHPEQRKTKLEHANTLLR